MFQLYNHTSKPIKLICMDGLTCTTFPGQVSDAVNQLSDGQMYVKSAVQQYTAVPVSISMLSLNNTY